MEQTRKVLSRIANVLAVLWIGLGLFIVAGEFTLVPHTIENSHSIEASFSKAASYVNTFQASESRLPTEAEFKSWASTQSDRGYAARYVQFFTSNLPQEAVAALGPMPQGSFALGYWRKDWEFYAGWSGASTLLFNPADYYVLDSWVADLIAVLAVGITLLLAGRWLRPNNSFKPKPLRGSA